MAKKTAGRLAGLAALAGAAYLASRGKGDEGDSSKTKFRQDDMKAGKADKAVEAVMPDMGEDERPAPTGMGAATKLLTPSKPASASRSAGSSPARAPGGEAKRRGAEEMPEGAMRGMRSDAGSGPNPARTPGGDAKRSAGPVPSTPGMGPKLTNLPDPRAPSIYASKEEWAKYRAEKTGGKSMVDRQNAAAKRAGLSVEDYYDSGKAQIDKQDGTFKRGGKVKKMASGGMTSSASKRADGIATKGKTRGRMC